MNAEQYTTFKEKYPDFDEKYVRSVPLEWVSTCHVEDQVRTNGENKDHLLVLKSQIKSQGQKVPITVQPMAPTKLQTVAGIHRYIGISDLCKESGGKEFTHIKVAYGFDEVNFQSRAERIIYQLNENTPSAQLPCDEEDYVQTFIGLVRDEHVLGANLSQVTPELIKDYIKITVPNIRGYRLGKISKKVMQGLPRGQHKYRNYPTKEHAAQAFTKINPWGLSVTKSGDVDQGWAVYFAESQAAIHQNNLHGAFWKKDREPDVKILIVAYCGNVLAKTPDLDRWRRTAIKRFQRVNDNDCLKSDINLMDGIVFLPQVQRGNDIEDASRLINPTGFSPTLNKMYKSPIKPSKPAKLSSLSQNLVDNVDKWEKLGLQRLQKKIEDSSVDVR